MSGSLWRIGPAWAVIAGAVASGAPLLSGDVLLRIGGAVVLADLSWGGIWRLVSAPPDEAGAGASAIGPLPYTQPQAPAGRVGHWLRGMTSWHEFVAGLVLMASLSLLLGPGALFLSVLALVVMGAGMAYLQRGKTPTAIHALLDVSLPWLLGTVVAIDAGIAGPLRGPLESAEMALAFTILMWGIYRSCSSAQSKTSGIWLGYICVLGALVGSGMAWASAAVVIVLLPPSWWLLRKKTTSGLTASAPWWLVSMILAAFAVGTGG